MSTPRSPRSLAIPPSFAPSLLAALVGLGQNKISTASFSNGGTFAQTTSYGAYRDDLKRVGSSDCALVGSKAIESRSLCSRLARPSRLSSATLYDRNGGRLTYSNHSVVVSLHRSRLLLGSVLEESCECVTRRAAIAKTSAVILATLPLISPDRARRSNPQNDGTPAEVYRSCETDRRVEMNDFASSCSSRRFSHSTRRCGRN